VWYNDLVRAQDDLIADPQLLDVADLEGHLVQMYEANDQLLVHNVGRYLAEGLRRGQGVLMGVTPAHRTAFFAELERLGADPGAAERSGHLTVLDASETLSRFMVGGYPNAQRFESTVGAAVRDVLSRAPGLRAYGELVGVLWKANEYPAAIRLEQLWNRLRKTVAFDLYCSYPIDLFDKQFQAGVLDALLCSHTHLLPTGPSCGSLEHAIERAMDEVLGSNVHALEVPPKANHRTAWPSIPKAEATILWLRANVPDRADAILTRARTYYQTTS
jgi:hypothetical protein